MTNEFQATVNRLLCLNRGEWLVSCSADGSIRLWYVPPMAQHHIC